MKMPMQPSLGLQMPMPLAVSTAAPVSCKPLKSSSSMKDIRLLPKCLRIERQRYTSHCMPLGT